MNRCADFFKHIGVALLQLGLAISLTILLPLSMLSFPFSWKNNLSAEVIETLTLYFDPCSAALILFAVVLIFVLLKIAMRIVTTNSRFFYMTMLVLLSSIALQLWWVVIQGAESSLFSDSNQLIQYASEIARGDYSSFDTAVLPLDEMKLGTYYFTNYPYQAGVLLYFILMFKVFSSNAPFVLQLFNIIGNEITFLCLLYLGTRIDNRLNMKTSIVLLLGLAFPFYMYSSFFYGNQIGLALAMTAVALNVSAMQINSEGKLPYARIMISFIPYSASIIIKPTYIVIAFAVVALWVVHALMTRTSRVCRMTALSIVIVLISNSVSSVPTSILESKLGYSLGDGIPKTAWIAMGLQNDSVLGASMPGWWNPYPNDIQKESNNDYALMEKEARREIVKQIGNLFKNPKYGISFFANKLGTEWLNPDFQASYFAAINYHQTIDGELITFYPTKHNVETSADDYQESICAWETIGHLSSFFDAYQSFIYTAALLGSIFLFINRKTSTIPQVSLLCIFVFGFILYTLWEAKSQYCLPFFMCLIPVAAYGITYIEDMLDVSLHSIRMIQISDH